MSGRYGMIGGGDRQRREGRGFSRIPFRRRNRSPPSGLRVIRSWVPRSALRECVVPRFCYNLCVRCAHFLIAVGQVFLAISINAQSRVVVGGPNQVIVNETLVINANGSVTYRGESIPALIEKLRSKRDRATVDEVGTVLPALAYVASPFSWRTNPAIPFADPRYQDVMSAARVALEASYEPAFAQLLELTRDAELKIWFRSDCADALQALLGMIYNPPKAQKQRIDSLENEAKLVLRAFDPDRKKFKAEQRKEEKESELQSAQQSRLEEQMQKQSAMDTAITAYDQKVTTLKALPPVDERCSRSDRSFQVIAACMRQESDRKFLAEQIVDLAQMNRTVAALLEKDNSAKAKLAAILLPSILETLSTQRASRVWALIYLQPYAEVAIPALEKAIREDKNNFIADDLKATLKRIRKINAKR